MRRPLRVVVAGLALAGGFAAGAAISTTLTASADDGNHGPTANSADAPTPTAPPTPFVPEPGTLDSQLAQAQDALAEAAEDPNAIVCLTAQRTLAGRIDVDRPAGAKPFTTAQKNRACSQAWPGSAS